MPSIATRDLVRGMDLNGLFVQGIREVSGPRYLILWSDADWTSERTSPRRGDCWVGTYNAGSMWESRDPERRTEYLLSEDDANDMINNYALNCGFLNDTELAAVRQTKRMSMLTPGRIR